jgi:hypothetical protein
VRQEVGPRHHPRPCLGEPALAAARRERLSDEAFTRRWEEILAEEATGQLLAARVANEERRYLRAMVRISPVRFGVSRLRAFCDSCARAGLDRLLLDRPAIFDLIPTLFRRSTRR